MRYRQTIELRLHHTRTRMISPMTQTGDIPGHALPYQQPRGVRTQRAASSSRRAAAPWSACLERPDAKISPFSRGQRGDRRPPRRWATVHRHLAHRPGQARRGPGARSSSSYTDLWNTSLRKLLGEQVPPIVAEPDPVRQPLQGSGVDEQPLLRFLEAGLPRSPRSWAEDVLKQTDGPRRPHARREPSSICRQLSSAFSPSNFPLTNPEVLRADARQQLPATSCRAWTQPRQDMEKSGDLLKISQTDTNAFEVGTQPRHRRPARSSSRTTCFQLIQYAPTTDKVREVPLLVVPPWINKYYILDLTPPKSLPQVRGRPGLHGLRRLVGQPGRAPRRTRPSRTTCSKAC